MIPCLTCERFVARSTPACPFCGAAIRLVAAPSRFERGGGFAGVLLGLTLAACSTEPGTESSTTVADTGTNTSAATEDASATSTTGPGMSSLDADEAEVSAYAGPGTDSFPGETTMSPSGSETTAAGSGSETASSSETGTGRGSSGSSSGAG